MRLTSLLICRFFMICVVVMTPAGSHSNNLTSGDPSLQEWLLPERPPFPEDNPYSSVKAELGKMLFFDPRLSGSGSMSCATCHIPYLGWSNGKAAAIGLKGTRLRRAVPSIINSGYSTLLYWDGRERSLEAQVLDPLKNQFEMNADMSEVVTWLNSTSGYKSRFQRSFPNESISKDTIAKAIATFERTVVSNQSPFDRWVKGQADAMSPKQVRGFELFISKEKGNCAVCHSAPYFTDESFHNIGLESQALENADLGRYEKLPLPSMKGAFKTPSLRDVERTAPYFHDGSAKTLKEVIEFYVKGGVVRNNISPDIKELELSESEQDNLVAFLQALTSLDNSYEIPALPVTDYTLTEQRDEVSNGDVSIQAKSND